METNVEQMALWALILSVFGVVLGVSSFAWLLVEAKGNSDWFANIFTRFNAIEAEKKARREKRKRRRRKEKKRVEAAVRERQGPGDGRADR